MLHVLATCMLMHMWDQRVLPMGKKIASRCANVDPYEASWAIQNHLFKMHKKGQSCIVMDWDKTLYVDKNILLSLIRDSLTCTYMAKENAICVFNIIATSVARDW